MSFSSPYNFIPMSETVHYPEWKDITHDQPEEDTLSGTITYELENYSPLLIGDENTKKDDINEVHFFKTPDHKYAIPGSSLKGMIRNWIEIATHSKMNLINDDWLSYRDLHNKEYINKITKQGESKAGWLRFEDNEWWLYPADLWFVKSKEINRLYKKEVIREKSTALDAYKESNGIKQIFFTEELTDKKRKATGISKTKKNSPNEGSGWLIFTGQIQSLDNGSKFAKKHHYVFSDPKDKDKLNLNTNVLVAFLQMVDKDKDKDKNLFQYFKKQKHKNGIPVFYLTEKNAVAHIGFSKMLRLTYKHPVKELKYDSHNEKTSKLDFSELLFGSINDNQKLKGRVNFSLATCQTNSEPYALPLTVF